MNKNLEAMETGFQANGTQLSRRVWEKPEAKAAEVAQATLAGNTTAAVSDLATCAS